MQVGCIFLQPADFNARRRQLLYMSSDYMNNNAGGCD